MKVHKLYMSCYTRAVSPSSSSDGKVRSTVYVTHFKPNAKQIPHPIQQHPCRRAKVLTLPERRRRGRNLSASIPYPESGRCVPKSMVTPCQRLQISCIDESQSLRTHVLFLLTACRRTGRTPTQELYTRFRAEARAYHGHREAMKKS